MPVVLHGPAYSTYARTARLALEEKGVGYELREVNILAGEGQRPEHLARQPWGKVPAFEHDGFALFETFAITRYVDEAFPGPRLQPEDARARARMTQMVGVLDSYGYGALIGKLFWQHVVVPMTGGAPDQAVLTAMPNVQLTEHNQVPRREKIRFCLSQKGQQDPRLLNFVDDDINNVMDLFGEFNAAAHGEAGRYGLGQLGTIKTRVEGAIQFLHRIVS